MAYWDSLINIGTGQPKSKVSAYSAHYPIYEQQTPQYPTPSPYSLAQQGYRTNEVVYACIGKQAKTIAEPPCWVYDDSGETPEEIKDHDIRHLLRRCNERVTERMFWQITQMHLSIAGFAAWEKERNNAGDVIHLWPMRPDWCSFYRGDGRPLRAIRYQPYGLPPADIAIDDVILFQYFDPLYPLLKGFSPTMAALKQIGVDNNMTEFLNQFMKEGAQFSGLLKTAQALQDAEAERLRQRWQQQHGGIGNWSAPAIIGQGVEYQNTGMTMRDMVFPDLDARTEARITMTFEVPPILLGAKVGLDASTYSNFEQARAAWYEEWVTPQWEFLADQFSEQILPEYFDEGSKDNYYCAFMTHNIKALQEDRDKAWTRATNAAARNLITRDEAREEMGKDPIDNDDVWVGGGNFASTDEKAEDRENMNALREAGANVAQEGKPGEKPPFPPKKKDDETDGNEAEQELEKRRFKTFAKARVKEGKPELITTFAWKHTHGSKRAELLAEFGISSYDEKSLTIDEVIAALKHTNELLEGVKGGEGSGNFGHEGRPGEVGGSAPEGEDDGDENPSIGKTSYSGKEIYDIRNAANLRKYGAIVVKKDGTEVLATKTNEYHSDIVQSIHPKSNVDDYVRFVFVNGKLTTDNYSAGGVVSSRQDNERAINNIYDALDDLTKKGLPKDTPIIIYQGEFGNTIETTAKSIFATKRMGVTHVQ